MIKLLDEAKFSETKQLWFANYEGKRKSKRKNNKQISRPFNIKPISGSVSVCQGCRAKFKDVPSKDNMTIFHWEEVKYKEGGRLQKKMGNGHYHNNVECVRVNHPDFQMSMILDHKYN